MFIRKKKLERKLRDAKSEALWEFVNLLRTKDKVYLEPLTLVGDGHSIGNCVFFGSPGMEIKSAHDKPLKPKAIIKGKQ